MPGCGSALKTPATCSCAAHALVRVRGRVGVRVGVGVRARVRVRVRVALPEEHATRRKLSHARLRGRYRGDIGEI